MSIRWPLMQSKYLKSPHFLLMVILQLRHRHHHCVTYWIIHVLTVFNQGAGEEEMEVWETGSEESVARRARKQWGVCCLCPSGCYVNMKGRIKSNGWTTLSNLTSSDILRQPERLAGNYAVLQDRKSGSGNRMWMTVNCLLLAPDDRTN